MNKLILFLILIASPASALEVDLIQANECDRDALEYVQDFRDLLSEAKKDDKLTQNQIDAFQYAFGGVVLDASRFNGDIDARCRMLAGGVVALKEALEETLGE